MFANKITLDNSEQNSLSDDNLVSEELNNFFQNVTKALNINENSYIAVFILVLVLQIL